MFKTFELFIYIIFHFIFLEHGCWLQVTETMEGKIMGKEGLLNRQSIKECLVKMVELGIKLINAQEHNKM